MKFYFNSLGVLTTTDFTDESIRQGTKGNTVYAYFSGISNVSYSAKFNFTRPDGSKITNVTMAADGTDATCFKKVLNDEWYLAIAGNATITIFLYNGSGSIIAQGQATVPIEQTDYDDDPQTITDEQYDSIQDAIANLPNTYVTKGTSQVITGHKVFSGGVEIDGNFEFNLNSGEFRGYDEDEEVAYIYEFPHWSGEFVLTTGSQTITGMKKFTAYTSFTGTENHQGFETHSGGESHSGSVNYSGQVTFTNKAIFTIGALNLYYGQITTNSKGYFARVGVTTGQYVDYKLPYDYSDVGAATYTLATTSYVDSAQSSAVSSANGYTDSEVNKIKNGTYIAGKATHDGNGDDIVSKYETKVDATAKVARANLVSIIGEATQILNGLMSATDKARLDTLYALLSDDDDDTVVNTIQEVLDIFENYPEGFDIVSALALKVNISAIVDALTSSATDAPLSANQGRVLKGLIDAIVDGSTVVGKANRDALGNKIDETYFNREDGFAIGLVEVSDYDGDTGEITLRYNSTAVTDITYNSNTGEITFTY